MTERRKASPRFKWTSEDEMKSIDNLLKNYRGREKSIFKEIELIDKRIKSFKVRSEWGDIDEKAVLMYATLKLESLIKKVPTNLVSKIPPISFYGYGEKNENKI